MKTEITQAEFVRGLTDPGIHRNRFPLNAKIENGFVDWDCPVCNTHNRHHWYGRDWHVCNNCQQPTSLKGATI